MNQSEGRHVPIADTRLYVVERGEGYPILIFHGGPGLDHHGFGDYLDPLAREYILVFVDQRSQVLSDKTTADTWSIEQMAHDVVMLSERWILINTRFLAIPMEHWSPFKMQLIFLEKRLIQSSRVGSRQLDSWTGACRR